MFHTIAFSQALTTTNVGTLVTPVVDSTVTINGNNLLIPEKINQLFAGFGFSTAGTAATKVQVQTPSLREVFWPSLSPIVNATTPDANSLIPSFMDNPIPLQTQEGLNIQTDALSTATAGQQGAVIFLSDGKRAPVQSSKIYTMRFTTAIALSANSWVNGSLTFDQPLPVGNYDVVGLRVEGTGLMAARLVFVGQSAITRPGCPGNATALTRDLEDFRYGRSGVWGTFFSITPPSLDCIGATGTTQVGYLDLIPK